MVSVEESVPNTTINHDERRVFWRDANSFLHTYGTLRVLFMLRTYFLESWIFGTPNNLREAYTSANQTTRDSYTLQDPC